MTSAPMHCPGKGRMVSPVGAALVLGCISSESVGEVDVVRLRGAMLTSFNGCRGFEMDRDRVRVSVPVKCEEIGG